ncbi:MAG TPA: hypothetical protein DCF99_02715, partial [Flavobacteriaceae bacterium]|nr:hypothetical protein [Flavobacteriaceae bacterium]
FGTIEESTLIWENVQSINTSTFLNAFNKFRNEVIKLRLSHSDITVLVQTHEIGMTVCQALDKLNFKYIDIFSKDPTESRQKKMWFF